MSLSSLACSIHSAGLPGAGATCITRYWGQLPVSQGRMVDGGAWKACLLAPLPSTAPGPEWVGKTLRHVSLGCDLYLATQGRLEVSPGGDHVAQGRDQALNLSCVLPPWR